MLSPRLAVLAVIAVVTATSTSAELQLKDVQQELLLTGQTIVRSVKYGFTNSAGRQEASVVLCDLTAHAEHLSFQEVVQTQSDDDEEDANPLVGNPFLQTTVPHNISCTTFQLQQPLGPGKSASLASYGVYTKLLSPRPAEIAQADPQRVVFTGSHLVPSPYQIASQLTTVVLPSSQVEAFTKLEPTKHSGSNIKYGPYKDTPPFAASPMRLHFPNNNPFAEAEVLEREVEVSHWGNVAVDEQYSIRHVGAKQKPYWSRLDYMMSQMGAPMPSVREFRATLPSAARSLYYRDAIGNISTSHARFGLAATEVDLRPRYPLFGGWKADFRFGYSLPLGSVAQRAPNGTYQLRLKFSPAIAGLVVKDLTVRIVLPEGSSRISAFPSIGNIVLPEGSSGISAFPPMAGVNESRGVKHTYLDVLGRPVLVLKASNVVALTDDVILVNYRFSRISLLLEPGLVIMAFAVAIAAILGFSRLDLSLGESKGSKGGQGGGPEIPHASPKEVFDQICTILTDRDKVLEGLERGADASGVKKQLSALLSQLRSKSQEMEEVTGMQASITKQLVAKERQLHNSSLELAALKSGKPGQDSERQGQLSEAAASARSEVQMLRNLLSHAC